MIVVEIFSKDDCQLCEAAKQLLRKVKAVYPFELKEVTIREGDEHFDSYHERVPVILIEHEFAFQYRVSEEQLLKKLQSHAAAPK